MTILFKICFVLNFLELSAGHGFFHVVLKLNQLLGYLQYNATLEAVRVA